MTEQASRLDKAYAACRDQALEHYENFPVGSFLLPKRERAWIHAVYAYARTADDFADEQVGELNEEDRIELLDRWENELDEALSGRAQNAVFVALERTIREARLEVQLLRDLLSAFRQDVVKNRYENFAEVLDYCRRSANPVGRLVLQVFDYRDEERAKFSDSICTALQLANFWQDIGVDIEKDRVYLPLDEMEEHNVSLEDLKSRQASAELRRLVKFQCDRTEQFFDEGRALVPLLGKSLRLEIKLTWLGGSEILRMIRRQNYDTLSKRPKLSKSKMLKLFLESFFVKWRRA